MSLKRRNNKDITTRTVTPPINDTQNLSKSSIPESKFPHTGQVWDIQLGDSNTYKKAMSLNVLSFQLWTQMGHFVELQSSSPGELTAIALRRPKCSGAKGLSG